MNRHLISKGYESHPCSQHSSRVFGGDYGLIYRAIMMSGKVHGMRFEHVIAWTRAEKPNDRGRKSKVKT